ncbi:hypothetical protein [Stieleria neptunia]|uniref:hypothetical protein n=1 Tax=Stieleria neptunia TaxID=2527979 RepID=UPI0011A8AA1B|nr:hypothetical protein [Stieleria neptunia]
MLDPQRPYAFLNEREPIRQGCGTKGIVDVATVFLTASRCPIGCSMCDLHRNTLSHPSQPGAIPTQIRYAQQRLERASWIKLYNSGNFFDPSSIPPQDYATIGQLCAGYDRVIIENHPRFGSHRHDRFRQHVTGKLEVAVGLETVQPRMLQRLGKQMSRDDFDRYANALHADGIDLRVFLIVGAPQLSVKESMRWARLSIRHALHAGARHISLIPARAGHGWNGTANSLPRIELEHLVDLYAASLDDVRSEACLSVDLWEIAGEALSEPRRRLLERFESAILEQDANLL